MKTCIYCGRENEDHAVFCSGCGTNEFKQPKRPSPRSGEPAEDVELDAKDQTLDGFSPDSTGRPGIRCSLDENHPEVVCVEGRCKKEARCDSCGHQYSYVMKRVVPGRLSAFIPVREQAQAEAVAVARLELEKVLEEQCDSVPCPKCGALTSQMKERERKARHSGYWLVCCAWSGAAHCWPWL